ncbi:MAG: DUF2520 domain-containing protein [Pyrinomonadaceae bacterium]
MGMQSVSIIGIGRIGGALAIALSRSGVFEIDYLVHRDRSTSTLISPLLPKTVRFISWSDGLPDIESDIVLITTADPDIGLVADAVRGRLKRSSVVMHTSGSLSSQSLSALSDAGHPTASVHPLLSVSDAISGSDNFANAFFCVEGHESGVRTAESIVTALGGQSFSIDPEKKPLYHAAAVTACGHLVALIDIAVEMLSKCGIEKGISKEILLPLISSTVDNLEAHSPERALTGSFARLDVGAVERHLSAIDGGASDLARDVYLILGERSLDLAALNGANTADLERMRELISIAKRKSG